MPDLHGAVQRCGLDPDLGGQEPASYSLSDANMALADLRESRFERAAVLIP
jgi:hypothetical protein